MLALPLPILTFVLSAVACVLVWRINFGNPLARGLFTAVFVLIAAGTLLVGLRFGYGVDRFIALQRIIPLFVGPVIYLGFLALMHPPEALWRKGTDRLTYAALGLTAGLRRWMLYAAGMLGIMLIFDTSIAISFALQRSEDAVWLVSLGSFISMLSLIAAIIVFSRVSHDGPVALPVPAQAGEAHVKLERDARALLTETRLYLDTDLSLERLAKRLHVPARALSEAINQTQSVNVSQYVNRFRLEHAAVLLRESRLSVTKIMEQSGFLTRSNFYREFERVYEVSPTVYRKQA
jgi:AraC-like DNA-binding protein